MDKVGDAMSVKIYRNGNWEEITGAFIHNGTDWEDKDFVKVYENGAWVDKWVREVILDKGTIVQERTCTIEYPDEYQVTSSTMSSSNNKSIACTLTFWAEGTFTNPSLSLDFGAYSSGHISEYCAYARVFAGNQYSNQMGSNWSSIVSEVFSGTFQKIGFELVLYTSQYNPVTTKAKATGFYLNNEKLRITARP